MSPEAKTADNNFGIGQPMSYGKQLHEYRKTAVNGASPLQLIVMLYDGALKFIDAGKRAMELGNVEDQNVQLQKAQKIVMELMSCLDMNGGGEVAQNLLALYSYAYNQLVLGNVEDQPEMLDQAAKVLTDLRESWVELERMTRVPTVEVADAA